MTLRELSGLAGFWANLKPELAVANVPTDESAFSFCEDGGPTLAYRRGGFMKRQFRQTREGETVTIEISAPEGSYRPAKRDLILETWQDHEPASVTEHSEAAGAEALPRLNATDLANSPSGWSFSVGMVTIKDSDRFGAVRFVVQN